MPITYQKLGSGEGLFDLVITSSPNKSIYLKRDDYILSGYTGENGQAVFKNLTPGTYTAQFHIDGSGDIYRSNITISNQRHVALTEKFSGTPNIDLATGIANTAYKNNLTQNNIVTIPGARQLDIEVWCSTESISYDWLAIYPAGVTPSRFNYDKASISNGKIGGNSNGGTYNKPYSSQKFTVSGDTAQFFFVSDGSGGNYGYYARIVATDIQI